MNEDLGTLSFKFLAQTQAYKQAVAEMDRMTEEFRKRAETPIRFTGGGGMGGGGSGGGGMGVSHVGGGQTSVRAPGPSIIGTSNGDVTWRLRDALEGQTLRDASAMGVRRSMGGRLRGSVFEDVGGEVASDYVQQGRIRMAMGDAKEVGRRQAVIARQQEIADSLMSANGATELSADAPQSQGVSISSKLKMRIPIRTLVRSTVYGLVTDAIAGMSANEATYSQSMTLAGNNQGLQARAELQRFTGGLRSIPLIGGILGNLASPFTTPIETNIELANRQESFQDERSASLYGRASSRFQTQAIQFGPNGVSAHLANLNAQRLQVESQFQRETAAARAQWDASHPEPEARVLAPGVRVDAPENILNPAYTEYRRQVDAFNSQQNSILQTRLGPLKADAEESVRQGVYQNSLGRANLTRLNMAAEFRPNAGEARSLVEAGQAMVNYARRPGAADVDVEGAEIGLRTSIAQLGVKNAALFDNLRYGTPTQYDPYVQSTSAFTDRNPESMTDQLSDNTKAIVDLTAAIVALHKDK